MELRQAINVLALCVVVAAVSAGAMYFYLMRSAVGRGMRAELEKKYGRQRMRQALAMPHPDVPETTRRISPRFVKIYEQAVQTEQDGHDEVCGIAYGKALEVLIKDYAALRSPDEIAKIRKASLADCIAKYVDDESIRTSTDLARWLRNDETHYERSFSEHGAPELRGLIGITMFLIEQADIKQATDAQLAAIRQNMEKDRGSKKSGA